MGYRTRRRKAIIRRRIFLSLCSVILVAVIGIASLVIFSLAKPEKEKTPTPPKEKIKESYAKVLSTGDIMVHTPQLYGAKNQNGEYDFSHFFKEAKAYFKNYDLNVANLEVTFGGEESGKFDGYPKFNTPDTLADAIKNSGLNFLITSNNHSYDTGLYGLKRTAKILDDKGIEFIGTRETAEKPLYTVKEINNIKIGMANFTYETSGSTPGRKFLNGSIIAEEANDLISSFSYNRIEEFYHEADRTIKDMENQGAEFIVFYIHWGEEYQLSANTWQKSIAQKLSNLGVDIIIGSHPHVVQPIELIHSEDGENTTVCLYSTGNAVSNQRQEIMDSCPSGHTEDGLFFTYSLRKYGEEVTLESIDIIPTWVNKYLENGGYKYTIYPLDNIEKYGFNTTALSKAQKSLERTKQLVKEGLNECQKHIGCEETLK